MAFDKKNVRGEIDRRYRRLSEENQVTFRVFGKGEQYRALAKWAFEQKRLWSAEKGTAKALWLQSKAYESFYSTGLESESGFGGLYAFALYFGEQVIAVQINRVDSFRVECVIVARDQEFAKYGVGTPACEIVARMGL